MNKFKQRLLSAVTTAAMAAGLAVSLPSAKSTVIEASAASASDYDTAAIVRDMGLGWNLGNSLDCPGGETSWGNPRTSRNMILAVKAKGFNTIRVPVTWADYMDSSYTVSGEWMTRVKEVVDYAYDEGMYVILNSHHDEWNKPTNDNLDRAKTELAALWTQIADEFRDYDYHLIFEGMNEPRNYGGSDEWNDGSEETRQNINTLNKVFIDTVRATGGNNSKRSLMIPGNAASISYTAMNALSSFMDTLSDTHVIASLHAYAPYYFAMDAYQGVAFNDSFKNELNNLFQSFDSLFLSKGHSVVIGEFSASDWTNTDERVKWAECYANNIKTLGSKYPNASVSGVLWDNNSKNKNGSECHGYFNRGTLGWYDSVPVVNKLRDILGNEEQEFVPEKEDANGSFLVQEKNGWTKFTKSFTTADRSIVIDLGSGYNNLSNLGATTDASFQLYAIKVNDTYTIPTDIFLDASNYNNCIANIWNPKGQASVVLETSSGGQTFGFYGDGGETIQFKVNGTTTTIRKLEYFLEDPDTVIRAKYKQFTALDDSGKYCERAVFEIKRSELDKLDSASITFTYKNYSKTVTTHKYFTKILADGNYASSQDGYVFVMCTLTGIPNKLISLSNGGLDINIKLNYL